MRFADPHACPSCGGPIAGVPRCPRCGLDLTSPEMSQVWQLLLQADALLERATSRQPVATPAPPPPAAYVPPAPQAAFAPPAPQPPPAAQAPQAPQAPAGPPPSFIPPQPAYPTGYPSAPPSPQRAAVERRWSVGTVLLALGTFGLIVAGFIFVTREWGSLDLLGRTLVLLGVTVVIGALGAWVTRRTLRASAEAVWTVFLGLVTLDFFAARHEGLAGLDGIDVAWSLAIWGVILVGLGAGLVLLGRRPLGVDLVAPSLATGAGIALTGIGLAAAPDDWSAFWRAFAGLVVTGVLGLAVRPTGMRPVTIAARVVVAVFFLSAFVAALVEVGLHAAIDELVQDGHGAPALLMAAAAVVVGAVVPIVRGHAAALAVLALSVLAVAPASAAWETEGVWLSVAVVAVVPLLIGARGTGPWWLGVRLGATPAVLLLGGFVFLWATRALASMAEALDTVWPGSATGRVAAPGQGTDVAWTAVVALAMALVVVWFVASWPELGSAVRSGRRATTIAVAGVALVEAVVLLRLPVVAAAAVLLVGAAAATVLRDRGRLRAATAVAVGLVVAAGVLATSSQTVTWSSWLVGAAVLALLARVERASGWLSGSLAGAALGIGAWALGIALDDAGASHAVLGLVIVLVGLAALGGGRSSPARSSRDPGPGRGRGERGGADRPADPGVDGRAQRALDRRRRRSDRSGLRDPGASLVRLAGRVRAPGRLRDADRGQRVLVRRGVHAAARCGRARAGARARPAPSGRQHLAPARAGLGPRTPAQRAAGARRPEQPAGSAARPRLRSGDRARRPARLAGAVRHGRDDRDGARAREPRPVRQRGAGRAARCRRQRAVSRRGHHLGGPRA
jgi:hypothetical protein